MLDRPAYQTVVDLLLHRKEKNQRRNKRDHDAGADDFPLGSVGPLKFEEGRRDNLQALLWHVQKRHIKIIVDRDSLYDEYRYRRRAQKRQNDPEKHREVARPVDDRRFVDRFRHAVEELQENIHGDNVPCPS